MGGYTFELMDIGEVNGPNYKASRGRVEVTRDGQKIATLFPEKRNYFSSTMPMTEASIDSGITRDIYVSLGEKLTDGPTPAWAVRVYHKPFVIWIWLGCFIMAFGGALAALDRRYRKKLAKRLDITQAVPELSGQSLPPNKPARA